MESARVAALVCLALTVTACGPSDPKALLVGQWRENLQTKKWTQRDPRFTMPKDRTIHFFADGSGVSQVVYDEPEPTRTLSFRWSLSEDGTILKTETPSQLVVGIEVGGPRVARIVTLTTKALRIDEASDANGLFDRVN